MKKNKTVIPDCFQPHKTKATHSSIFGFLNEKTLVSYVPKPNKAVVLISSEHHTDSIVESSDSKPEIILFYNATKGSVDAFDQQVEKYTCRRKLQEELSCKLIKLCAYERYRESASGNHTGIHKNLMMSYQRIIEVERVARDVLNDSNNSLTVRKRCSHMECKGNSNKHSKKCQECNLTFCNIHCEVMATTICKTCLLE